MPSAASAVPMTRCRISATASMAARSPASVNLRPARDDLLHQSDAIRLPGPELVTQHQVVHGVSPPGAGDIAEVSAAQRGDAALALHLAEPRPLGRHDD